MWFITVVSVSSSPVSSSIVFSLKIEKEIRQVRKSVVLVLGTEEESNYQKGPKCTLESPPDSYGSLVRCMWLSG